jgi:ADP-ribosylglycohydrolase
MTDKNPEEKKELLKKFKLTIKEKRAIGSMLGMAIGDAMGARYEFKKVRYDEIDLKGMDSKYSNFNMEPGQWTDDTSMGLCLADSLLMNKGELDPHDLMKRFLCWWYGGYNNAFKKNATPRHSVGLGGNISQSFKRYFKYQEEETGAGDENTSGNGSIMRNAAIPICFYKDIDIACEMARKQSLITHQGDEAKECCSLLTHIIVKIFNGEQIKEIVNNLGSSFHTDVTSVKYLANHKKEGYDKDRNWDWTVNQYFYSPTRTTKQRGYVGSYVMDNMAMSLNTIYRTNNFKDAIIRAVNIRGDSDSVASVVGQIAGALYPIETVPGDWIKAIYRWDHGEIALRGYMLARIGKSNNSKNVIKQKERLSYVV